jgi:2',3'-cyclic-nucleotide 2'-phosphodiesterase/3'-nucleotidase
LIPKKAKNYNPDEIPLVMPRKKAMFLSVIDIEYSVEHKKIRIIRKTAKNIKVHRNKLNMKMLKKYQAIQSSIFKFVNQPVGELAVEFSGERSRREDTPLIDFIHKIQKEITGADISIASSFNTHLHILPGEITRKNIFAIYPYENTLYKIQMKGKYLVDLLKRSANYYFLKNGQLQINREVPGYNFDLLDGIRYELIYRSGKDPIVKIISMDDGTNFNPEKEYIIAVNSYRAQQLKKLYHAKIIWRSEKTMRDYIEDYFKKHSPVRIEANNNWKIVIVK